MRAALTLGAGGPVEVRAVDEPTPGDGEAAVTVHAASVNRLDHMVYLGRGLGARADFPLIQGLDAAGVLASELPGLSIGARVVIKPMAPCGECRWCQAGLDADCARPTITGIHRPGGFAEMVVAPATTIVPIPDGLSFAEAAAAAHVYPVALRMIRASELVSGETVLVTGSTGAVGSAGVQLARAHGAMVLAVCSSDEKAEAASALGADAVLVSERVDIASTVDDMTDGAGVDVILDSTGIPLVSGNVHRLLARRGRYVVVGAHAGSRVEVDLTRLYQQRQRIIGSASASLADFRDAYTLLERHYLHPLIGQSFGLDEIPQAFDALGDRTRTGKVMIHVR